MIVNEQRDGCGGKRFRCASTIEEGVCSHFHIRKLSKAIALVGGVHSVSSIRQWNKKASAHLGVYRVLTYDSDRQPRHVPVLHAFCNKAIEFLCQVGMVLHLTMGRYHALRRSR